jgi:hypothetical protein
MERQDVQRVAVKVAGVEFPVAEVMRVVSQTYEVKCVSLPPDEEMCDTGAKCLTYGTVYPNTRAWIRASSHEMVEALDHEAELHLPHWKIDQLAHGITDYVLWLIGLGGQGNR